MKAFWLSSVNGNLIVLRPSGSIRENRHLHHGHKSTENVLNKDAGLLNLSEAIFSNSGKDSVILTKTGDEKAVPFAGVWITLLYFTIGDAKD